MYDVLLVCLCGFKVSADFRQSDLGERVGLRKRSETRATAWRWLHGHQPGSPTRRDTARIARARLTVPSEELRLIYRRPRLGTASSGPSNLQPREPREERQSAETAFFFPLCSYRRPHTTSFFFFIYFGFFSCGARGQGRAAGDPSCMVEGTAAFHSDISENRFYDIRL